MDILCIEGDAPGAIVATISHCGAIRQLPMLVDRHPHGGWHIQQGDAWGPRCHAVTTAVLLEASEAFTEELLALS